MPRLKNRQNVNKKKLECDDIVDLFIFADSVKCQLPTYVAVNLKRVPAVVPGELDVYSMAMSVAAPTSQVEMLTKKLETVASDNGKVTKRIDELENSMVQVFTHTSHNSQPNDTWTKHVASHKLQVSLQLLRRL